MRPKKSTLLGAEGGPCCSSERSRTAPIAPELIESTGELALRADADEQRSPREARDVSAVRPRRARSLDQEVGGFLNCQPGHRNSQSPLSRGGAAVSLMGSQKASALPSARMTA